MSPSRAVTVFVAFVISEIRHCPLSHTLGLKGKVCPSFQAGRRTAVMWSICVVDRFLLTHNALDRVPLFCFHHQKSILSAYLCLLLCWAGSGDTGQMWACPLWEFRNLTQTSQRLTEIKNTQTVSRRWITVISGQGRDACLKAASVWGAYSERQVDEFATFSPISQRRSLWCGCRLSEKK